MEDERQRGEAALKKERQRGEAALEEERKRSAAAIVAVEQKRQRSEAAAQNAAIDAEWQRGSGDLLIAAQRRLESATLRSQERRNFVNDHGRFAKVWATSGFRRTPKEARPLSLLPSPPSSRPNARFKEPLWRQKGAEEKPQWLRRGQEERPVTIFPSSRSARDTNYLRKAFSIKILHGA